MRALTLKIRTIFNLDKIGIFLSFLCAVHCLLTPILMLSLPILARYYLAHPLFHWILAILIFPTGVFAFLQGYMHHQKKSVFFMGIPGLLIITVVPTLFHQNLSQWSEPIIMVIGSLLLVSAHWINRRSCSCEIHQN